MEFILQKIIFILVVSAATRCYASKKKACNTTEHYVAYVDTININDLTLFTGESNDSLIEIVKNLNYQPQTSNRLERTENTTPSNCKEATAGSQLTGIYNIQVDAYGPEPFPVSCETDAHGGGWTVVLRRMDGSVDFFRDWNDYKNGFGNLMGEFFIGLDKLYALANVQNPQELIFVMEDFENVTKYARYSAFAIGNEAERYVLKSVGDYFGDAGDSFTHQLGQIFETRDVEDDNHCASLYKGAWWYLDCHFSNLCGLYLNGQYGREHYSQGINWKTWHGYTYSLKFVEMMIRPLQL